MATNHRRTDDPFGGPLADDVDADADHFVGTASGAQLDQLAALFSLPRKTGESDPHYRKRILSQILQHTTGATIHDAADERWTPGPVRGRAPEGHCPHCGEPLPVIIDGKCPNCEIPIDDTESDSEAEPEDPVADSDPVSRVQHGTYSLQSQQYIHFGGDLTTGSDEAMSDEDDGHDFDSSVSRDEPCSDCGGTKFRLVSNNRVMCQGCGSWWSQ